MSDRPVPQKMPVVVEVEAGDYYWCRCGKSATQPYCDGAHKGSEWSPMKVTIDEKKRVAWCACKRTDGEPFCDGAHAALP